MVEWCTQKTCAETASVLRGTSNATTKERYQYITSVDIKRSRYEECSHSLTITRDMSAVSQLESRE